MVVKDERLHGMYIIIILGEFHWVFNLFSVGIIYPHFEMCKLSILETESEILINPVKFYEFLPPRGYAEVPPDIFGPNYVERFTFRYLHSDIVGDGIWICLIEILGQAQFDIEIWLVV